MKKFLLTIALLTSWLTSGAVILIVEENGVVKDMFPLEVLGRVDLTNGLRIISDDGRVFLDGLDPAVTRITLNAKNGGVINSITNVETPDAKVVANGGWLRISGAKAGARVAVYTIGGKMLSAATMNAPEASIDLSTVADGVYIVTVGNKSYKVTKRN
ncbi:MAG: T9SS type A sorting domain-containing protein [Bacteroidaceae bacterium]|nr:T9SS type A sorting domain-containing protein [Bacteroidaceae bacterium]